jgi:outer membrane protein OmpA-like peptidoglycan-associated protein
MNSTRSYLILLGFVLVNFVCFSQSEKKFSLYYENDAFELTEEHQHILDSIVSNSISEKIDIHIKGYTNTVGSSNYNLELSRRRAENVKGQLRMFTIISSIGYGELEDEAAVNRRVDILIHNKTDHVAVEGEVIEAPTIQQIIQPVLQLSDNPQIGDKVVLEGIMFYADRDVIMDESRKPLEELVGFLERNPQVHFKLIGHICCGDKTLPAMDLINVRTGKRNLSEARAQSVHNFLVKRGIDKRRIRYVGMAYGFPTGKGDTFDRRVEIEITRVN